MATFTQASITAGARTLPGRYYTSASIFRDERARIFARRWCYVGREEALAERGSYFLAAVAGESLVMVRDDAGGLHAHYNVCRHRGTRLCTQERGKFGGSIQCPYHAWTYGLDGSLMTARNMHGVSDFRESDYPLCSAGLASWEGFLFVNLARRPQSFTQTFAPLIDRVGKWGIGGLKTARSQEYDIACNWKLLFQNYSECYHCPVIHPALDRLTPSDGGRNDLTAGPFLGGYMTLRRPGGSMTQSGNTVCRRFPKLDSDDHDRVYYYSIFPSMLLSLHPDYVMVHQIVPIDVGRTKVICSWLFDPTQTARPDFDPSDAVEFWNMTNAQDWRVCELAQLGVASRAYVPGPYAHQEGLLHAFDVHYLSLMNAGDEDDENYSPV